MRYVLHTEILFLAYLSGDEKVLGTTRREQRRSNFFENLILIDATGKGFCIHF